MAGRNDTMYGTTCSRITFHPPRANTLSFLPAMRNRAVLGSNPRWPTQPGTEALNIRRTARCSWTTPMLSCQLTRPCYQAGASKHESDEDPYRLAGVTCHKAKESVMTQHIIERMISVACEYDPSLKGHDPQVNGGLMGTRSLAASKRGSIARVLRQTHDLETTGSNPVPSTRPDWRHYIQQQARPASLVRSGWEKSLPWEISVVAHHSSLGCSELWFKSRISHSSWASCKTAFPTHPTTSRLSGKTGPALPTPARESRSARHLSQVDRASVVSHLNGGRLTVGLAPQYHCLHRSRASKGICVSRFRSSARQHSKLPSCPRSSARTEPRASIGRRRLAR